MPRRAVDTLDFDSDPAGDIIDATSVVERAVPEAPRATDARSTGRRRTIAGEAGR